jgi:outer membrane protein OmpA-like peptidoglycan-associated protein
MRLLKLALLISILGAPAAYAQQVSANSSFVPPRFDVSAGYNYIRANAPPGGCPCFSVNGGYFSADYHAWRWLGLAAEVTGGSGSKISTLGQNLTLITYMAGPRIGGAETRRISPFAQVLFGGVNASNSYFPTSTGSTASASSWAYSAGGGIDFNINNRFAIRLPEVQFLQTNLPNGANNKQNLLMAGVGIVVKFGGRSEEHAKPAPVPKATIVELTCTTNSATVEPGQTVEILGNAVTDGNRFDIRYSWTVSSGTVEGHGSQVRISTTGMPAGDYHVKGHAFLTNAPDVAGDCETSFRIKAPAAAVVTPAHTDDKAEIARQDRIFHENVQDALFDYDSYQIRPDGQTAIQHAAEFLKQHPELVVLIGGYADERGSAEYNLVLGEERAKAAREALIAAGVEPERLKIITYGKEAQVCTQDNEACWQQNRRAAFSLHQ